MSILSYLYLFSFLSTVINASPRPERDAHIRGLAGPDSYATSISLHASSAASQHVPTSSQHSSGSSSSISVQHSTSSLSSSSSARLFTSASASSGKARSTGTTSSTPARSGSVQHLTRTPAGSGTAKAPLFTGWTPLISDLIYPPEATGTAYYNRSSQRRPAASRTQSKSSIPSSGRPAPTGSSVNNSTNTTMPDPVDPFIFSDYKMCDYSITFKNLDDLNANAGKYRSDCNAVYSLQTLLSMLETSYNNYTNVNDGYDTEFGYYVTYMKKLIPSVLDTSLMINSTSSPLDPETRTPKTGSGMSFFDCHIPGGKDTSTFNCGSWDKHWQDAAANPTVMTLRDQNGWTKALTNAGISLDWVDYGAYEADWSYIVGDGGGTNGGPGGKLDKRTGHEIKYKYSFTGFPIENATLVITNPKDIVTKGLGNVPDLMAAMQATVLDIMLGTWSNGSVTDPSEAYSTPVFMFIQAIDNMAQAKQLGQQEQQAEEQAEEERRKNLILLIISIVLIVIPIVGEELAEVAGLADLASAISMLGDIANAADAIYNTVQDPNSALINVLGLLGGLGKFTKASRDGKGLGEVAAARRGMTDATVNGLGKLFKENDDKLQSVMKVCGW